MVWWEWRTELIKRDLWLRTSGVDSLRHFSWAPIWRWSCPCSYSLCSSSWCCHSDGHTSISFLAATGFSNRLNSTVRSLSSSSGGFAGRASSTSSQLTLTSKARWFCFLNRFSDWPAISFKWWLSLVFYLGSQLSYTASSSWSASFWPKCSLNPPSSAPTQQRSAFSLAI